MRTSGSPSKDRHSGSQGAATKVGAFILAVLGILKTRTLTRLEMYELAWSEPMQSLAKKFSLSDRGLAKICASANIPVPSRGY